MYRCESWTIKKAECWRTDAFQLWCWRTLESPLDSKKIKPVNPKESQLWIFIGRTDAEAPILWPPDLKSRLIGKDPDAGQDWRKKEKGWQDEMVGWHHWVNGHESEQTPADGERQGSLVCCSPQGCKELYTTGWQNNGNPRLKAFAFIVPSPWKYFSPGGRMENIAPICVTFSGRPFLNPRPWDSSLSSWLCLCPWPSLPFNVFKLNYLFIVCLSLFELISMRVSILVCGVY